MFGVLEADRVNISTFCDFKSKKKKLHMKQKSIVNFHFLDCRKNTFLQKKNKKKLFAVPPWHMGGGGRGCLHLITPHTNTTVHCSASVLQCCNAAVLHVSARSTIP